MPFAPPLFTALAEQLAKAHRANVERRMSVQVTGLADTVRRAKAAIDSASVAAVRLESSANAVVNTIGAVDDMTRQLDAANANLQAAVGAMTNGDPNPGPLSGTTAPVSRLTPAASDIPTAVTVVQAANAEAAQAYVAPPVVTASTIAAANAAAALNQ